MISLFIFAGLVAANLPLVPLRPLAADGASFALAAVRIGQPHLPYPIHTILSIPLARMSSTSPAWGVNLLSTLAAAATCAVVYVLIVHLAR
ncbi:MAG: DUF2723 domain-containing protein, partial [Phycisphaerales bacterium]|nr:DUF2723 domain-containing protein [Phycisphaerales bacterium]